MALLAGLIWSFGAITARLANNTDAFQYLLWRCIGIVIVVEGWRLVRRQRPPRDHRLHVRAEDATCERLPDDRVARVHPYSQNDFGFNSGIPRLNDSSVRRLRIASLPRRTCEQ